MGTTKKNERVEGKASPSDVSPNPALVKYVAELNAQYGGYAKAIGDVRNIIDDAMGDQTLTGLLYKSRNEDARR